MASNVYLRPYLCAYHFGQTVHLFTSSLPRFDKCHETSRIFPRTEQTFASARSFDVISWASFSQKDGHFGLGRAPSASQKALSKSKGTFLRKNECAKWYQNFGNVKSLLSPRKYSWRLVAFVKAWEWAREKENIFHFGQKWCAQKKLVKKRSQIKKPAPSM